MKAVVAALKKHPILNSALDETTNELVYRKYYNIGIAASTDAGPHRARRARTPTARASSTSRARSSASRRTPRTASRRWRTSRAPPSRSPRSARDGGLFATPIINFPEVGILGVHQIKQKPVVKDGQIVIGDVMLLSLSFDHRIVDGHVGAAFAYDIIDYLEDPDRLFLEMV